MNESPETPKRARVHEQSREYDGIYKLERVVVQEPQPQGGLGAPVTRLVLERGDAAAVLLYDPKRDVVILTRQFRYPVYLRDGKGWMLEIVAGTIAPDADPESEARRETLEEVGYRLGELEHIASFYPSSGGCSEHAHLFAAVVTERDRVGPGGGVDEGEAIQVVELPAKTALERVMADPSADGPTLIALQWLEGHKERLGKSVRP